MGTTIHGTIWAQWIDHVKTYTSLTKNVSMNNRDITVFTALNYYSVGHPYKPEHPVLPDMGYVGVTEVEWSNGDTLQGFWPAFVMYQARRVKFEVYDARASFAISYFNLS
jgi:hypothetical protein